MKFPKPEQPLYKTTLPISGREIQYRPYTVKEEELILLATTTQDKNEIIDACMQVIENCASVEIATLHPIDVEWIYLKLYKASVGKEVKIDMDIDCGDTKTENCPPFLLAKADLDKIEISGTEILEEAGYVRKKDGWLIPFGDNAGIVFKLLSTNKEDGDEVMFDMFVSFYVGEQVVNKEDITLDEFKEWVQELPVPYRDKIDFMFEFQPWITLSISAVCPACKKVHTSKARDLIDFLG